MAMAQPGGDAPFVVQKFMPAFHEILNPQADNQHIYSLVVDIMSKSLLLARALLAPFFVVVSTVSWAGNDSTLVGMDWSGSYLGGNMNWGQGKLEAADEFADLLADDGLPQTIAKPEGASAALRGGYDVQIGQGVFGLGADYTLSKYDSDLNGVYGDIAGAGFNVDITRATTVFARAGYAFDTWLAYALLGYTWADGKFSTEDEHQTVDLDGTTYGVGADYAINPSWSAYAEYTLTDFGTIQKTEGLLKAEMNQLRLGVNFRF